MKGQRTGYDFVEQEQENPVPDKPNLHICSLNNYRELVEKLDDKKGQMTAGAKRSAKPY